jgi:hypothetical protein
MTRTNIPPFLVTSHLPLAPVLLGCREMTPNPKRGHHSLVNSHSPLATSH